MRTQRQSPAERERMNVREEELVQISNARTPELCCLCLRCVAAGDSVLEIFVKAENEQ
jgi:hypothetical protein